MMAKETRTSRRGCKMGIQLDRPDIIIKEQYKVLEDPGLKCKDLFLSAKNLFFIFFKLFGNVPFGINQGLLS